MKTVDSIVCNFYITEIVFFSFAIAVAHFKGNGIK